MFEAHTDPDLVARWIGPRGTQLVIRELDARTGGSWSYVITGKGGEWAFHGSFHEVTAPTRLVQTFRSRLDGLSLFLSVEDRDAMLADMDSGMDENFDRLDELFAANAVV